MNSNKQGWVRLHRKIEDNPLWFLEPFTRGQAWVDLFLNANHKDGEIFIRGNIVPIKRGQLGWSEITMTKRWQWSKGKVRRFLKYLETVQQIEQQKYFFLTTIITIINYEHHQSDSKVIQQTVQQTDSRRYTNKNDKNEKNISGALPTGSSIPLGDNQQDMNFKNQRKYKGEEGHWEETAIDMDSQEPIVGSEQKQEMENKELNKKIRHNLKLIEPLRGKPFGIGQDLNFHVKIYRTLIQQGWSHNYLVKSFMEIVETDHWKEKREQGEYAGMNTLQFHLRNKKVQ